MVVESPETRVSVYDRMTVNLPECELDGVRVGRVTVKRDSIGYFRDVLAGRSTRPGEYTALFVDGQLWMSDTDAEKRDHIDAVWRMRDARRVLINGLGLGMVLAAALSYEHVEHVDVVELDARVVKLIGPYYADPRVVIHHADAYEQAKRWPRGTRWDVAWHDIWSELGTDNLPDMAKLHRSYGRRVGWQGSWGHRLLLAMRRRGY